MKKEEIKDAAKLLNKPYLRGSRVEYKSESPTDVPPGLDLGRDDLKLGLGDKPEPKATVKTDHKVARGTDS